jgi:hypothetical protein
MRNENFRQWDRRPVVRGIGVAVLAVQCLPSFAQTHASPGEGNGAGKDLLIHSTPGFAGHKHDLLIPYAVLDTPPAEGITLESTQDLFHTHSVALTQEQLVEVRRGGAVRIKASSHIFLIALAGPDHRPGIDPA